MNELLTQIQADVASAFLAGLALGIFTRWAARLLAIAAVVFVIFHLLREAGAI